MATKTETISNKVSPEKKARIKELAAAQDTTDSKFLYRQIFGNGKENVSNVSP